MKKIILVMIWAVSVCLSQAVLLVEETWDYGIGSASSTWTGGVGYVSTAWDPTTSGAVIADGLTFGTMTVSGGSAHILATAGSSTSYINLQRQLSITTVDTNDLWIAYLVKFDTANSSITQDEGLEVRPEGPTNIRTGIDENSSAFEMRYGSDWETSTSDTAIKVDGETFLLVFKYPDMGAVSGADGLGWALTASQYDSIASGGLTEVELNATASLLITNSFSSDSLVGNATMQFTAIGRNNSTPSFYVDEYRVGTSLDDVVAEAVPAAGELLVEETWDYGIDSDSSTWTNGIGFNSTGWDVGTSGASISSGLTFGSMEVSGGAVHLQGTVATGTPSYNNLTRQLGITTVSSGDLWISYLVKFDTVNSTVPNDEGLEVRPEGPTGIRNGINENTSAMTLRYGSDTITSDAETAIKGDGETFLFVFKYPDMGVASGGGDALGWGLTASQYDSVVDGGLTEEELTAVAGIVITNDFASETLVGNATMQFSAIGRGGSTPSFYVDEYRVGSSLDVVVASASTGVVSVSSSIFSLMPVDGGLVKMVVNSSSPSDSYPKTATNLVSGGWGSVAHSDDGVNAFVITNLSYSTASGSNQVIYLQADTPAKFFGIGGQ